MPGPRGPPVLRILRLGVVRYNEALALQTQAAADVAAGAPHTVLLLQHFPVYTVGKRNTLHNFKVPLEELRARGIDICHVARGGETTFHGPGQAVLYPILRIRDLSVGARRYVEGLEDVMIRTCASYGVKAQGRLPQQTGVWVQDGKIGAVGVQISGGVTRHGLAFNVNTDLSFFEAIVPCGIEGKEVTSLATETGPDKFLYADVEQQLLDELCSEFGLQAQDGEGETVG